MEGSLKTIQFLRTMFDASATENERQSAFSLCRRHMESHGLTSYEIFPEGKDPRAILANTSDIDRRAEMFRLQEELKSAARRIEELEGQLSKSSVTESQIQSEPVLTPERFLKIARAIARHEGKSERAWAQVMADILTDPKDPEKRKTVLTIKQMTRNPLAKIANQVQEELEKRNLSVD